MKNHKSKRLLKYYEKFTTHGPGIEKIPIENGAKRYTGQFYNCEEDDIGDYFIKVDAESDFYYRLEEIEDPYSGNSY